MRQAAMRQARDALGLRCASPALAMVMRSVFSAC
jgi:hypothetical protein